MGTRENAGKPALDSIVDMLKRGDGFALAGHTNPDGDAIGACFALGLCLRRMGKSVWVILEDYNEKYSVIPGGELLYTGDVNALFPNIFIGLDCSGADRLGAAAVLIDRAETTICIDHHVGAPFGRWNYVDDGESSTCQLVYDVVSALGGLNAEVAAALYAGLVYDTGGFRHSSTTPRTLETAAKLLDWGIPFNDIYTELMHYHTVGESRAYALALSRFVLSEDGRVAYSWLTAAELAACGAGRDGTDGIAEYLLNIRGVEVAAFISERADAEGVLTKASLRAKSVDVGAVAREYGGGGHNKAAGCTLPLPAEEGARALAERLAKAVE